MITTIYLILRFSINSHVESMCERGTEDVFQTKTSPFSTHHIILVHYKVLGQVSQPISLLFSYLNSAQHDLVIELCRALLKYENENKTWLR